MTRKVHVTLPPKLEDKIREQLENANAGSGGVYVYIRHKDGQRSATPPLTQEDKNTIKRMYRRDKATVAELAKLYGKSRQAIYFVLREPDDQ
tara:strand:+ start:74 stop:349 length:276 start_codon:yes stop_codon:yes gene_type:complete